MDIGGETEANHQLPAEQSVAAVEQPKAPQAEQQRMSSFVPLDQAQPQQPPNVPQSSPTSQTAPISIKIFEKKLAQATQLKNSGNAKFKSKNYVQAIKQYSEALRILDPTQFYGATQEECQKMAELSSNLLCNIGFCYFNSLDMYRADLFFSQAIAINPKYIKALHKRALARFELKKYQEAFEDIKLAFSFDKSNAEIHGAYSKILEKYNQQKKKTKQQMKELSSKIFNTSQKSATTSPKKQPQKEPQTVKKAVDPIDPKENKWSWPSVLTLAGAATLIGAGLYRAFKN